MGGACGLARKACELFSLSACSQAPSSRVQGVWMPPESLYRFRTNRRCLALKRGRDVAARVLISDADADTDTDTGAEMQIQMEMALEIILMV